MLEEKKTRESKDDEEERCRQRGDLSMEKGTRGSKEKS
jgi:hypothetical protein